MANTKFRVCLTAVATCVVRRCSHKLPSNAPDVHEVVLHAHIQVVHICLHVTVKQEPEKPENMNPAPARTSYNPPLTHSPPIPPSHPPFPLSAWPPHPCLPHPVTSRRILGKLSLLSHPEFVSEKQTCPFEKLHLPSRTSKRKPKLHM